MRTRGVALAVVLALSVVGCARPQRQVATRPPQPSHPASPTGSPIGSPTGSPTCPASGVLVRTGASDAAAGMRVLDLEVTNCGSVPYVLAGYPTLRVLDAQRRPYPVTVTRKPPPDGYPERQVRLDPGRGAMTTVEWHDIVTDGTPVTGTYLEVRPRPGDEPQVVAPRHGVDLGTTGTLSVEPWNG